MSDYTHISFDDVPDMAPGFGMTELEARFARDSLGCQGSGVTLFRMQPGFRVPFGHKHTEQEETYVLVSGGATMKIEDDIVEMKPWDVVRVAPSPMRAAQAGPEGAVVLVFGAGPKGDGEMVQGWWAD